MVALNNKACYKLPWTS